MTKKEYLKQRDLLENKIKKNIYKYINLTGYHHPIFEFVAEFYWEQSEILDKTDPFFAREAEKIATRIEKFLNR